MADETKDLAEASQKNELSTGQVTDKMIKDFLLGSNTKLSDNQLIMFLNIAKGFNLNPFKREIYAIPYNKRVNVDGKWVDTPELTIVTGYQTYIERAMRSGQLDGWTVSTIIDNNNKLLGARVTIHRKDWKLPFEWDVSMAEFAKKKSDGTYQGTWATMPEFMIKKVAIGQGFRAAFPSELGGMPYIPEEGEGNFVQEGAEIIPGESTDAVIEQIQKKFNELAGPLLLNIDPDPKVVNKSKAELVQIMGKIKVEFKIVDKSPEYEAMIKMYQDALAILSDTKPLEGPKPTESDQQ